MPIDSISATNGSSHWQQVRNDFQTLAQSLQSGNVQSAQKAYDAIQKDQQNGPQPPANSPIAQAFTQLGQALQSGDIAGAQQAFSSFQNAVKDARQAHGGRGPKGDGAPPVEDSSSNDSDSSDATKTVSNETTVANADGTITVTTTYSDGSKSTETKTKPTPVVSQNPLAANAQQLATLLNAQEQAAE